VRVIRQVAGGPATARNRGIQAASGTWIAFTDDDCRPHHDWLVRLTNRLRALPESMVGGHTANALTPDPYAAASQLLIDFLYRYFDQYPNNRFFTSNNMAGSRRRLKEIGGFDEGFPYAAAEDRDLCDRWREGGGTLIYEPAAAVDHSHIMSFRGFLRQHFRYGRGAWLLRSKRAARGVAFSPEPLRFYLGLLTAPFRDVSSEMPIRVFALLFLSQVLNVAGFMAEDRRERTPFLTGS
jgi:GT2 family glycosyltransferase